MRNKFLILFFLIIFSSSVLADIKVLNVGVNMTAKQETINGTSNCKISLVGNQNEYSFDLNNTEMNKQLSFLDAYSFKCVVSTDVSSNESTIVDTCKNVLNENFPIRYQEILDKYNIVVGYKNQSDYDLQICNSDRGNLSVCNDQKNAYLNNVNTCNTEKTELQKKADQNIPFGIGGILIGAVGYYYLKVKPKSGKTSEEKLVGPRNKEEEFKNG